jgi:hypothetical protein
MITESSGVPNDLAQGIPSTALQRMPTQTRTSGIAMDPRWLMLVAPITLFLALPLSAQSSLPLPTKSSADTTPPSHQEGSDPRWLGIAKPLWIPGINVPLGVPAPSTLDAQIQKIENEPESEQNNARLAQMRQLIVEQENKYDAAVNQRQSQPTLHQQLEMALQDPKAEFNETAYLRRWFSSSDLLSTEQFKLVNELANEHRCTLQSDPRRWAKFFYSQLAHNAASEWVRIQHSRWRDGVITWDRVHEATSEQTRIEVMVIEDLCDLLQKPSPSKVTPINSLEQLLSSAKATAALKEMRSYAQTFGRVDGLMPLGLASPPEYEEVKSNLYLARRRLLDFEEEFAGLYYLSKEEYLQACAEYEDALAARRRR